MPKYSAVISFLAICAVSASSTPYHSPIAARDGCYTMPGDESWPDETVWSQLNSSVGGRLIQGKPLGSVCHDDSFNSTACDEFRDQWALPDL